MIKIYNEGATPEKVLREISATLESGDLVIVPTDTRYSVACDALNASSVEHLARLKGIDPKKSTFSILCADISQASEYVKVDNDAFRLIKQNSPGPFTYILPPSSSLPKIYKGRKEVGIRIPDYRFLQELISFFGHPLTGFSLPIDDIERDEAYEYHPELIEELWSHEVHTIIDGGMGKLIESAVIDCTKMPYQVLRNGPIPLV